MKSVKVFDDLSMMPIGVMNLNQLRDEMGDAVVESVEVVDGNLVITFNTASGKQPITIPLSELSQPLVIETTYAELVAAKNGGTLAKGAWYRITDYVTTTAQSNTQSAGHAFDVIVRADSESVLNENAFAIQHEGDTYFANQKLSAWELKYDINNDTNKYAWADETNGKGVIYYMKDENDNECPYDFKNIQFKVGAVEQAGTTSNVFYFTFSVATDTDDATVTDHSLNGAYCYGNKMGLNISSNKHSLNTNVFRNTSATSECYSNTFGNNSNGSVFGNNCNRNTFRNTCQGNKFGTDCQNNTLGNNCSGNTFGNSCANNTLGNNCSGNTFGNSCGSNAFGNSCISNTLRIASDGNIFGNNCRFNTFESGSQNALGTNCTNNTFGNNCTNNTFGNSCGSNAFGTNCTNNTFGNSCGSNTFGNSCGSNAFGNSCSGNTFGTNCTNNTFGNSCGSNAFGNSCTNNAFGNSCSGNTFGTNCYYNTFEGSSSGNRFGDSCYNIIFGNNCISNTLGTASAVKSYYKNIIFENGVGFVQLDCTQATSSSAYCQNVLVGMGIGNKTLTVATAGNAFKTTFKTANDVEVTA